MTAAGGRVGGRLRWAGWSPGPGRGTAAQRHATSGAPQPPRLAPRPNPPPPAPGLPQNTSEPQLVTMVSYYLYQQPPNLNTALLYSVGFNVSELIDAVESFG